jgi:hypothetical protein
VAVLLFVCGMFGALSARVVISYYVYMYFYVGEVQTCTMPSVFVQSIYRVRRVRFYLVDYWRCKSRGSASIGHCPQQPLRSLAWWESHVRSPPFCCSACYARFCFIQFCHQEINSANANNGKVKLKIIII